MAKLRTKAEIADGEDFKKFGIEIRQIEDAGPVEPGGITLRLTPEQWQRVNDAWQRGERPFGMEPPVSDPHAERADELLASVGDVMSRRAAAFDPEAVEDDGQDIVSADGHPVETVRLADGSAHRLVRGVGLQRVEPDDPALRGERRDGWRVRVVW